MKKAILLFVSALFLMPIGTANAGSSVAEARQMLTDLGKIMKSKSIDEGYQVINGFSSSAKDGDNSDARSASADFKNDDMVDGSVVFCVENSKIVAHPDPSMVGKPYGDTPIIVTGLQKNSTGEVALSTSAGGTGLVDIKTGKPIGGQEMHTLVWNYKKLLGYKKEGRKFFCAATFR